jgi:hypothetical protein
MGADDGSVCGGGAGDAGHESGVVFGLAVPIQQGATETVGLDAGSQPTRFGGRDPARRGKRAAWGTGGDAQRVAGTDAERRKQPIAGADVVGERDQ